MLAGRARGSAIEGVTAVYPLLVNIQHEPDRAGADERDRRFARDPVADAQRAGGDGWASPAETARHRPAGVRSTAGRCSGNYHAHRVPWARRVRSGTRCTSAGPGAGRRVRSVGLHRVRRRPAPAVRARLLRGRQRPGGRGVRSIPGSRGDDRSDRNRLPTRRQVPRARSARVPAWAPASPRWSWPASADTRPTTRSWRSARPDSLCGRRGAGSHRMGTYGKRNLVRAQDDGKSAFTFWRRGDGVGVPAAGPGRAAWRSATRRPGNWPERSRPARPPSTRPRGSPTSSAPACAGS